MDAAFKMYLYGPDNSSQNQWKQSNKIKWYSLEVKLLEVNCGLIIILNIWFKYKSVQFYFHSLSFTPRHHAHISLAYRLSTKSDILWQSLCWSLMNTELWDKITPSWAAAVMLKGRQQSWNSGEKTVSHLGLHVDSLSQAKPPNIRWKIP